MGIKKAIKQIGLTALFAALGTVTVSAADFGQASGEDINVRVAPNAEAEVIVQIDKGKDFLILDKENDWYLIFYEGKEGYVSDEYFDVTNGAATIEGAAVNLRKEASATADSLGKYANGDAVWVVGQNDEWFRVRYMDGYAYVEKDYVKGVYIDDVVKIENKIENELESVYGVVISEAGLKLRKEASTISNVLTVLPHSTEVTIDRVGQEWVRIITDSGVKGYVSAEFLSIREGERTTRSAGSGKGAEVVAYGKQFIGTPYVWGGTNLKKGVDCSGFVYSVYKNFGITLNRSSSSMASNGIEVSKANLQAGDLVFFNSGGNSRISHVGIYCGDGTYVHSTDGKAYGVTVTDLNSGYSANTYVTARRVLR